MGVWSNPSLYGTVERLRKWVALPYMVPVCTVRNHREKSFAACTRQREASPKSGDQLSVPIMTQCSWYLQLRSVSYSHNYNVSRDLMYTFYTFWNLLLSLVMYSRKLLCSTWLYIYSTSDIPMALGTRWDSTYIVHRNIEMHKWLYLALLTLDFMNMQLLFTILNVTVLSFGCWSIIVLLKNWSLTHHSVLTCKQSNFI